MYLALCVTVFLVAYTVNVVYISVFYHRGLAHGGVELSPVLRRFVVATGNWVTGLDPLGWVCMHRMHHMHSDTEEDPHSPVQAGILGVALAQLRSYEKVLVGLTVGRRRYTSIVADLDFAPSWTNRKGLWWAPYAAHAAIGLALALLTGMWLLATCYFVGMMSHPVQGWLVNSFGHALGGRNFDTPDNSRNNHLISWFVVGEGFQNNHHRYPRSARFSYRRSEIDLGYAFCWLFDKLGLLRIRRDLLIPSPTARQLGEPAAG